MSFGKLVSALVPALLLCGCAKSEVEKAKENVEFLQRHHASGEEMCAAEQRLAAAYRETRDDHNYDLQKMLARQVCLNEELSRRLGQSD